MRVFLNERSFPEKSSEPENVFATLSELTYISGLAKKISNNQHVRRSRELKNREVISGTSLVEYIISLGNHPDPKKRNFKSLFLELFAKGPFISTVHEDADSVVDVNNQCLKNSCFDEASSCRTGAAVISVEASDAPMGDFISIESSIFGRRKILNITTLEQINRLFWVYQSNEKHDIPKDVIVNGEAHSAMLLSDMEAQSLLSNGIMIGKCIFNKIGEQWYKFHCHEKNIYHGFPIVVKTPYKEFSAARILFEEILSNSDGQLFEELLNIR
jgi:hypothetical protein